MKASEHFKTYVNGLIDGLVSIDINQLDKACQMLSDAYACGSNVFVCGNGGSAAISDHFLCDHLKGVNFDTGMLPQVHALANNMSLMTAIANDIGYEEVFSFQLNCHAKQGDILVVISSSGNSRNIVLAIEKARALGMKVIAMVGFDGGYAGKDNDCCIWVKSDNYGIVEDAHQSVMHIMAQTIRKTLLNKDTIKL